MIGSHQQVLQACISPGGVTGQRGAEERFLPGERLIWSAFHTHLLIEQMLTYITRRLLCLNSCAGCTQQQLLDPGVFCTSGYRY
jgi:hypothetical protein